MPEPPRDLMAALKASLAAHESPAPGPAYRYGQAVEINLIGDWTPATYLGPAGDFPGTVRVKVGARSLLVEVHELRPAGGQA